MIRPLRPLLSPLSIGIGLGLGRGGSSSPPFTPADLFPTYTGAWWTAYDQTYMTVNSDGTGGSPAVGGTVGRLIDRSGGGNHPIQVGANKPLAQDGYLGFSNVPGVARQQLQRAVGFGGTTQSMTGLIVIDLQGIPDPNIPFDWGNTNVEFELTASTSATNGNFRFLTNSAFLATTLKWTTKRMFIAWRGSPTAFNVNINGVQQNLSALVLQSLGRLTLGAGGGGFPVAMRFYEGLFLNVAVSDAEFDNLCAYGASQSGSDTLTTDILLFRGDSLTAGDGSMLVAPAPMRVTQMPDAKHYGYGKGGDFAFSPGTTAAQLLTNYPPGAGRNIAVFWMGTNDLLGAGRSAVQTETAIRNYCTTLRAGGYKVVVCTLQDITTKTAEVIATNALITANALTVPYADAIADLGAQPELQDCTDLTYFNADQVHLTDAGYAVVTSVVDAAIASIP
jgi:lysophospholipase L1-like esterase